MGQDHTTAVLLARVRGGDQQARQRLFERVEPLLRRWAHGRLPAEARGGEDTEDIVQSALVRVLGRLDQLDVAHAGAFYGYLRQIALNLMRDALRRQRGLPQRVDAEHLACAVALPGSAIEAELGVDGLLAYEQALARLPTHYRELVLMRFEFGMSFPEIGAELGAPPDNVRMKLNRALKQMAGVLDDAVD